MFSVAACDGLFSESRDLSRRITPETALGYHPEISGIFSPRKEGAAASDLSSA
jgi:hypothetical protein